MADPRFFRPAGPFRLGDIATRVGAALAAGADPDRSIHDVRPLDQAGPEHLGFLENRRYLEAYRRSRAGACLVEAVDVADAPPGMSVVVAKRPRRAFALAAQMFYPDPLPSPGCHASAVVDPSAVLGEGVVIAAGAVVAAAAEIGARTRIGPNAVIEHGVKLGRDCAVGANASVSHALIGDRVVIYPGVRIGTAGFGFEPGPEGHVKVPQLGRVIIGDDVEVGANSTIDRGSGPDTVIGRGTMIDNLVQIGHNVQVGEGCILVAQVGIAGSTQVGNFVTLAGQVGVAGHLAIGDGATVGPQAGLKDDVPPGQKVMGTPAVPIKEFWRQVATLRRLAAKKGN
jgi:UDP-3-O-[3-hydroxymyristoyl] glucosamine N-acyltransferase